MNHPPAHILSFDLGKTSGWARFSKDALVEAGFAKFDDLIKAPPHDFVWEKTTSDQYLILIETPHHVWRSTPEDLINLGIKVGRVEEYYERRGHVVQRVKPEEWKGSVDAEVMLERIIKRLRPEELARVPLRPRAKDYDHNCVDAIGQGLWKLGRMHG